MTGAGKSTTILALLGHEMVKKDYQSRPWITPKKLLPIKGVENVIAYPGSKSVTRNVTAI